MSSQEERAEQALRHTSTNAQDMFWDNTRPLGSMPKTYRNVPLGRSMRFPATILPPAHPTTEKRIVRESRAR